MNRETNEITPEYNTEASASDHASSFSGSDISEIPALDAPGENRFKRFIRKIRQKPTSYLIYACLLYTSDAADD